jgi:predicted MFS family arabinose efflux permease
VGQDPEKASALVSIVGWILIPATPIGAAIAERLRQPVLLTSCCLVIAALGIWALPSIGASVLLLAAIAIVFGLPGGLIMTLPGQAAPQERRALVMGVYFTCYYLGMGVVPALAGLARDATHSAAAPIYVAGAMLVLAFVILLLFRLVLLRSARQDLKRSEE